MSATDDVLAAGRSGGVFAAIAAIAEIEDPGTAGDAYRESMRRAYWDEKDLTMATALAYAGTSRLLAASHASDADTAYRLRSAAKSLLFDLASFSWPGWDEEGITIGLGDAAAGLAAARFNLALANELEKGDLAVSRAHWMVGAHLLTAGDHQAAAAEFGRAGHHARLAGAEAEARLAVAFGALTDLASGSGSTADLDRAVAELAATEGGDEYGGQVETARRVLGL